MVDTEKLVQLLEELINERDRLNQDLEWQHVQRQPEPRIAELEAKLRVISAREQKWYALLWKISKLIHRDLENASIDVVENQVFPKLLADIETLVRFYRDSAGEETQ